jgi:AcrR family transcriptional regulator
VAALGAFSEKGFEGASTRAIAGRAGVNHGLIPYYFGSKEKLWQAAVNLAFEELEANIEAVTGEEGLGKRERAARMIRAYVRFIARRPEFVHLMNEEGKRRGPRMRWLVDRHVKPLYHAVTRLLEGARAGGGGVLDIEPIHFFYILAGASGLFFHQAEECKRVTGVDPFSEDVVEAHAAAVEQLLLGPKPHEDGST